MIVVMLGNIGVGKGTQGKLIMENYKIPYISTGDIFRENIRKGTELGMIVKEILEEGKLVSDDLVNMIVFDKIKNLDSFVIDGYPRTIKQAKDFENFLKSISKKTDIVIYLNVSDEVIIKRLTGRRVCPKCGKIYNIYYNKPKKDEICDIDNEPLIQRDDDKLEIIEKRIKEFNENTKPLVDFYKERKMLYQIDGEGTIDEIFQNIKRVLDDYIEK